MANANVAFGFKPVGKHGSSPATQGTSQYFIASDASAIFQGSPVKAELTGGTIQIGSATGNGDQLVGVFAGCEYVDATTGKLKFSNTWPGSGSANTNHDIKGFVYDDPSQRFIIASDGTNTDRATAKADIFKTADIAASRSMLIPCHTAINFKAIENSVGVSLNFGCILSHCFQILLSTSFASPDVFRNGTTTWGESAGSFVGLM